MLIVRRLSFQYFVGSTFLPRVPNILQIHERFKQMEEALQNLQNENRELRTANQNLLLRVENIESNHCGL